MAQPSFQWKYVSTNLWGMYVTDENGTEELVFDSDGYIYQDGTKITSSGSALNALSATLTDVLIDDGDAGVTLTSADQTNAAATVTIPDIADAADTFVMADTAQTLTAKTLTSPVLTTPKIADTDAGCTVTSADQTHASATATIPNFTGAADEFVMKALAQTLTNKTLTAPVFTNPATTVTLGAHDYGAAANAWTLNAAELLLPVHKPTNASGAVDAVVATTIRPYIFINATGYALTVKTAAGTGIAIANNKTATVMSDGVNVIRITPDA